MLTIPAGARHIRAVDIDTTSATYGKDAIYADVSGRQCSVVVFTVIINKLPAKCIITHVGLCTVVKRFAI